VVSVGKPLIDFWRVLTVVVATVCVAWVASVLLESFAYRSMRDEQNTKVLEATNPPVEAYRDEQGEILHGYRWLDRDGGVVRLPIERAMELVVEEGGAQ
jgi:hypothetical protein